MVQRAGFELSQVKLDYINNLQSLHFSQNTKIPQQPNFLQILNIDEYLQRNLSIFQRINLIYYLLSKMIHLLIFLLLVSLQQSMLSQILSITDMYYNEPYQPLFTINPLESRDLNRTYTNTFSTSKRSSLSKSQTIKPIKNRTTLNANKENKQCTFEPKVNPDPKGKRSISKFIRDQESFQKTKEDKIKQLRMEINRMQDEELTCTPKIDRNSKQIATHKNSLRDSNPFQRLSKQRISHIPTEQYIFSPKILSRSKSIVRTSNVSSLLYQDARRRQQKEQFLLQSQRKQIDMLMSPKINKNTNILVLKKINSQFDELITDQEINPLIALSVLEEIFNIDLNPNKNIANNQLVQKIIAILAQSENFGSLKSKKLKQFISIIVIGQGSNTFFTNDEENYIIQNFQHFYKRRMTKERKTPTPQKHTFRPKTLSTSSKMANSYREKTCQQLENFVENQKINVAVKQGGYSIQDIFQLEHMKRQNDNERKKIQKERRQLQECTFKPDLSTSQTSINLLKKKPKVTLKAPNRSKIMRTQYHNNDETQFSIQNSKILLSKNHQSRSRKKLDLQAMNIPLTENVKDAEKVLLRMSIGRQKRQFSQTIKERGYPKNQNWNEYQRQMHLQQIQNNKKLKGITGQ